eukprot:TRINITY_DN2957_c0_g1_i1.p1 TRINITY_DN2957_c0_g1~~TRINITY_DN2957_c0_g1_i1.p1  ORF type:complete len:167 (+),score=7.47 TRINITY_DN2957_c0_g1_i1:135-635(+)
MRIPLDRLVWALAISCVLLGLCPHAFAQSDLFWASAVDGDFSDYKWNADSTVPNIYDKVFLNATTQPYKVNVLGTFQVAALEAGLPGPPYSNVTLHFGGDSTLNVTSEVTLFPGAALSASGTNNTLQTQNLTINGGQVLIPPSVYITWKTSTLLINNGALLDGWES